MSILQDLYDSEINFSISTFWDGGFDWKLGDELNGFVAKGSSKTLIQTENELERLALMHYPQSTFAKNRGSVA